MKILIIEDEYNLAEPIKEVLKKENFIVDIDTDGEEGLYDALTDTYDLIILDVMLPHKNGFEILKEMQEEGISSKVIMLTAKSSIEDKMIGFNSGAVDYLTKPFHMEELIARVKVQLRKDNKVDEDMLQVGNTKLDIKNMKLINKDKSVDIIGKEFYLLELFMKNKDQLLDKEQIFNKIWGFDSDSEITVLEAYLSFIRKKLKLINSNITIKAVRGMGYKMEVKNEEV